jgi:hypothetical protein
VWPQCPPYHTLPARTIAATIVLRVRRRRA